MNCAVPGALRRPPLGRRGRVGHDEARRRAADAGMLHHLVKPIDPELLRKYLSEIRARLLLQHDQVPV